MENLIVAAYSCPEGMHSSISFKLLTLQCYCAVSRLARDGEGPPPQCNVRDPRGKVEHEQF